MTPGFDASGFFWPFIILIPGTHLVAVPGTALSGSLLGLSHVHTHLHIVKSKALLSSGTMMGSDKGLDSIVG